MHCDVFAHKQVILFIPFQNEMFTLLPDCQVRFSIKFVFISLPIRQLLLHLFFQVLKSSKLLHVVASLFPV